MAGLKITVQVNLDVRKLQASMLGEIDKLFNVEADNGIAFYNNKIKTWVNKTTFRKLVAVRPGRWSFSILHTSQTKQGKIFDWVDKGTGSFAGGTAYPINPKNAPLLRFTAPHSPKTLAPGQSVPSGQKTTVFTKQVMHPGIKPRGFTKELMSIYEKSLVDKTHKAARKGLQRR